jgi:hypothetical protein
MKILSIALGLSVLTSPALADIQVGRGTVSATATATATYDSNVFGTHDATSDYYGTLAPGVSYIRKSGLIEADADAGISFIRFLNQTQLNANNLSADGALRINPSDLRNYSGSLTASYLETSEVNTDINTRLNTDTTTFTGQTALVIGPRSDLSLSGNYTDSQYSGAGDQEILTAETLYEYKDFFYGNSLRLAGDYDKLHASANNYLGVPLDQNSYTLSAGIGRAFYHDAIHAWISYGYRVLNRSQAETSTGATQQRGSVITASLEGPFLPEKYFPKIKSGIELSYEDAATPGVNDTGGKELTGALHMDWQARDTTVVSFLATRAQRLSANDLTVVSTAVQLGLKQQLRYNLTGSLSAGYNWDTYRGISRSDQTILCSAGLEYHFARSWTANASYKLSSDASNQRESTYDRNVVSVSVTYQF